MKLLLASPRGFCAGVDRAVKTVERSLALYGAPIYVRHEIIHNQTVVDDFAARGVVFVDELSDVPDDALVIFSAHGVPRRVVEEAEERGLVFIDATCPLVTKVHTEAKAFHRRGFHILLVGHKGHVEVEGTMGQVPPEHVTLVETPHEARTVTPPQTDHLAVLTQTTLSVDETNESIAILKERFPTLVTPKKGDICYATQNRQNAVKKMAAEADVVLVVGSPASSNSNRLVETALRYGAKNAYLIDGPQDLTDSMTAQAKTIGLTAGASAPEEVVQSVIAALEPTDVIDIIGAEEKMHFNLPPELLKREEAA